MQKALIAEIFIILLIPTLALVIFGKILKQPPLSLAGFVFLFILGLVLLFGGLSYKTGAVEDYNYVCACCENGAYNEGAFETVYNCVGSPHLCDFYDGDPAGCAAAGCVYNETLTICGGTPYPCENYEESRTCLAAACSWLPNQEQPTPCENSSLTLKNITSTETFSNFDSEIYQGVLVNHVFGFFLCLIAAFGFVITLINLESFQEGDAYKEYRGP